MKLKETKVHFILILISAVMVIPFIWMILTAFKSLEESTSIKPFYILPTSWSFENFINVIKQYNFLLLYFNTFMMMIIRVFFSTTTSLMAGYAFGRLNFKGKNILFGIVLFQLMIPVQVYIIPQYMMLDSLNLRNTIFALAFPGLVSAFGTFLLRQYYQNLPKEIEEAALLDGCNIFEIFIYIMVPLAKSGAISLAIFTSIFSFKDMMWPLIVNPDVKKGTLTSTLARIQGTYSINYPQLMAAATIAIFPMIIVFIFFQKQITEGISSTGGKL